MPSFESKKKDRENKKYSACKTHLRFRNGCQKLEQKEEEKVNFTNKKWCSWHLNLSGPAWSNFVYYNVLLSWVAILILPMGGHSLYVRHWTKNFFEDAHNCILFFLSFFLPTVRCRFLFLITYLKSKSYLWNRIDMYATSEILWFDCFSLKDLLLTNEKRLLPFLGKKDALKNVYRMLCSSPIGNFLPISFSDRND